VLILLASGRASGLDRHRTRRKEEEDE